MPRRTLLLLPVIAIALGLVAFAAQPPSDAARVHAAPPLEEHFDRIVRTDDGQSFASRVEGSTTRVERLAPTRELLTVLDEPLQLRLADTDGKGPRLVFADPIAPDADAYRPGPRPRTRLVVFNVTTQRSRAYGFARNLEPEAFAIDNPSLFVIDHRPATNPTYYRVSTIDLSTGVFHELLGPNKLRLDNMTGTARHSVSSRSGEQLYTLYVQHQHTAAHEGADPDALPAAAFIHVLDRRGVWAACVDLPGFGHGPVEAGTIALTPDGREIVVTDTFAKKRATVRTADLTTANMLARLPTVRIEPLETKGA